MLLLSIVIAGVVVFYLVFSTLIDNFFKRFDNETIDTNKLSEKTKDNLGSSSTFM